MFLRKAIGASLITACLSCGVALVLCAGPTPVSVHAFYRMWGAVFVFLEVAILGIYLLMKEENDVQVPSELEKSQRPPCLWEHHSGGNWQTACGNVLFLEEEGPAKNGLEFCPYCGHRLEEGK